MTDIALRQISAPGSAPGRPPRFDIALAEEWGSALAPDSFGTLAAENLVPHSERADQWTLTGGTVDVDSHPYAGDLVADTLRDDDSGSNFAFYPVIVPVDATRIHTFWVRIRKDQVGRSVRTPALYMVYQSASPEGNLCYVDTQTGEWHVDHETYGGDPHARGRVMTDPLDPDYWLCGFSARSVAPDNVALYPCVMPAPGADWQIDLAATGAVTVAAAHLVAGVDVDTIPVYRRTGAEPYIPAGARVSGAGQIGSQLALTGFGSRLTDALHAGQILNINGVVTTVQAAADADADGVVTARVSPALAHAPADGTPVTPWRRGGPIAHPDLASDEGLRTAVLLSLFTDARALVTDRLPGGADRRGWWADAWPRVEGDRVGSRRWLLAREKLTQQTANRLRDYDREALQWLIDDGIAERVEITTEIARPARIDERIVITRSDGGRFEETFNLTMEAR